MEYLGQPVDVGVWKCPDCGARKAHPVPDSAGLRERYESEHSVGKWKDLFEQQLPAELVRRARLLSKWVPTGRRILDIGCGDGRFLDAARAEGLPTYGAEISWAAARESGARHPCWVGGLEAVDPQAEVGGVCFWDVLEHIPDPGAFLRSASGVLAPDGVVVLSMPNLGGTTSLMFGLRWPYYDFDRYGHIHHLRPTHLTTLLRANGFDLVYSESRGSVDLRDLPAVMGRNALPEWVAQGLDRVSGLLARVATRVGRGNTLLLIGRRRGGP